MFLRIYLYGIFKYSDTHRCSAIFLVNAGSHLVVFAAPGFGALRFVFKGSWTLSAFLRSSESQTTLQAWNCSFPPFLFSLSFLTNSPAQLLSISVSLYTFECLMVLYWLIRERRLFSSASCSLWEVWAVGICLMGWQVFEGDWLLDSGQHWSRPSHFNVGKPRPREVMGVTQGLTDTWWWPYSTKWGQRNRQSLCVDWMFVAPQLVRSKLTLNTKVLGDGPLGGD